MNPTTSRRRVLASIAAAGTVFLSFCTAVAAQDGKPIEWVVGMAPGGGSDVVARTVAEAMSKALGQTIIVNNKPGAGTNIAADYVAKARDSDNTLLTGDFATLATNPWLYSKLPYNAEKDLASVGMLVRFPLILVVGTGHPAKNLKDFVAWVKAQEGGANYASPGAGTPHHLATELLIRQLGLKGTHIPYRGAAPALQDVIGGQVPYMLVESASGLPLITSGKLRAIAVATSARMKTLPDVPTLQEQGVKSFEAFAWQGLSVPAAASPATIARLNKALVAALDSTMVKARFQTLGVEAMPGTPAQMSQFAQQERQRWGGLIKELGLRID
jgi:tripartite-type tricarboxylate transporter receptor subunit TctC